jgi:hypothetical protein
MCGLSLGCSTLISPSSIANKQRILDLESRQQLSAPDFKQDPRLRGPSLMPNHPPTSVSHPVDSGLVEVDLSEEGVSAATQLESATITDIEGQDEVGVQSSSSS